MKTIHWIIAVGSLFLVTACYKNCDCKPEELRIFLDEMNLRYGNQLSEDSIVCRNRDGLWMVKHHQFLDWQIMYDEQRVDRYSAMIVYKMPIRYAKLVVPFIRHARESGLEIEYIEKETFEDSLFSFNLTKPGGGGQVKQAYKFTSSGWFKKVDISSFGTMGEYVDLTRR